MTLYGSALFLHVVAAIGLVGSTVFIHATVVRARRTEDTDALGSLIALAHGFSRGANPLAIVVLAAGLYMAFAGEWWGAGWPVVSLVLFALAGVIASVVLDPWLRDLDARLTELDRGAPLPGEVRASLDTPKETVATWVVSGIDATIVALMTNKPGYAGALVVAAVAITLAAAIGVWQARNAAAPAAAATP